MQTSVANLMTERELHASILAVARIFGWQSYSVFESYSPARRSAKGWPDIFMVRDGRALAIELKREGKTMTDEQVSWAFELGKVPGITCYLWYPSDWLSGRIDQLLR